MSDSVKYKLKHLGLSVLIIIGIVIVAVLYTIIDGYFDIKADDELFRAYNKLNEDTTIHIVDGSNVIEVSADVVLKFDDRNTLNSIVIYSKGDAEFEFDAEKDSKS